MTIRERKCVGRSIDVNILKRRDSEMRFYREHHFCKLVETFDTTRDSKRSSAFQLCPCCYFDLFPGEQVSKETDQRVAKLVFVLTVNLHDVILLLKRLV